MELKLVPMKILVLNAGSSSDKLALYEFNEEPAHPVSPLWQGTIEWSQNQTKISAEIKGKKILDRATHALDYKEAINSLLITLKEGNILSDFSQIAIVGHRVVHGGTLFQKPTWITPDVTKEIKTLSLLAPLHNPNNLEGVEVCKALLPRAKQAAVFDTAFHATIPAKANTYAGPYQWKEEGIQRYGFHGISHQYCSQRCLEILKKKPEQLKIVCCHLGNGASLTAIADGKSIDTTMGFTPLEGLMMGTRTGSIDPSILLYLQKNKKKTPGELLKIINFDSGLKGISGKSGDMRDILQSCSQADPYAILAYDMYVHSLKRNLGAMIGVLNGLDALIFTAGIGENVPSIRKDVCEGLAYLGLAINPQKNQDCRPDEIVSTPPSKVAVLVIKTQEDWSIAKDCWQLQNNKET
jgi:acetate kinase